MDTPKQITGEIDTLTGITGGMGTLKGVTGGGLGGRIRVFQKGVHVDRVTGSRGWMYATKQVTGEMRTLKGVTGGIDGPERPEDAVLYRRVLRASAERAVRILLTQSVFKVVLQR